MIDIKDFQLSISQLNKELEAFDNADGKFVTVGIHEDAPDADDMTMAQLGAIQHFGVPGRIPARRWLDLGVVSGVTEYTEAVTSADVDTIEQALEIVAIEAKSAVQEFVRDLSEPPNAQSTIRKKGSSNPLIDTGEMLGSIDARMTNEKPKEGL